MAVDPVFDHSPCSNLFSLFVKKLYLFSLKTGAILPFSSSLSEIEPNVLSSGDCVLLEMVANKKKSL